MATVTLPNLLANGTTANGPEVRANDDALLAGVNNVESEQIANNTIVNDDLNVSVSPVTRYPETSGKNFVVDGTTWITSTVSGTLSYTIPAYVSYIQGVRRSNTGFVRVYTASVDTYVDQDSAGAYTFSEVTIGASQPSQVAGTLRLLKITSGVSTIDSVTTLTRATSADTALAFEYRFIEANPSRSVATPETLGNQLITLIFRGRDSTGSTELDTGTSGVVIDTATKQAVNGMDQNIALTAATPIDVYCIGAADGSVPVGGLLSYASSPFGTSTPILPTGYDVFRWVGTLMTAPASPDGVYVMPSIQNNLETILVGDFVRNVFSSANNGSWVSVALGAFVNLDHVGAIRLSSYLNSGGQYTGFANLSVTGSVQPNAQAGASRLAHTVSTDDINNNSTYVPVFSNGTANLIHHGVIDGTGTGGQGGNKPANGLSITGWKYKHE